MNPIADHLWQSTVFAGVVWLLTLVLRKNRARVRHGLWLAASIKFLVPFSLFIALGSLVPRRAVPIAAQSKVYVLMDQVSQPFTAPAVAVTVRPAPSPLPAVLFGMWMFGFIGITVSWWVRWRRIRSAVRAGSPVRLELAIRAISCPTLLEPGVFGIFRPVLLLPEGITQRLTPAQLQAVIAHELCHAGHRDNLIATIHMFVETVFWFHPLVWWIGKRMVEERERACDEEVLRELEEPKAYAEGILNVCKMYVESPLTCVSGVTGSNLKKRIEAIMSNRVALKLNFARRVTLATAGAAALTVPIVVGIIHAQSPSAAASRFDVASVKQNKSGNQFQGVTAPGEGRFTATNAPLRALITAAYRLQDHQLLDLPAWASSERFDINAKSEANIGGPSIWPLVRTLLEERFQLRSHRETRQLPVYELVVSKPGRLPESEHVCGPVPPGPPPPPQPGKLGCGGMFTFPAGTSGIRISGTKALIQALAEVLSRLTGRPVLNKTGLSGKYDIDLQFSADPNSSEPVQEAPPEEAKGPSLFTVLQDQLGLKLESTKGPVDVLVIDHVERPSEN